MFISLVSQRLITLVPTQSLVSAIYVQTAPLILHHRGSAAGFLYFLVPCFGRQGKIPDY